MINGGNMPFRSSHLITASVFACFLLWLTFKLAHRPSSPSINTNNHDEQPSYTLPVRGNVLGHQIINLTNADIEISRVLIEVSQDDIVPLPLLQQLDVSLPPPSHVTIQQNFDAFSTLPNPSRTNLTVPHVPLTKPNASAFIFGLATTYERLEDSLPTLSHWLSNTSAPLIGHMAPSLDPHAPDRVQRLASSLSIKLGTIESGDVYLDRYFGLLKVLHANRLPTTKWYVFVDDDTFFVSMYALLDTFSIYNPTKPWYIGALTEDFSQMGNLGYFAYGGGGIFLSHALVEELLPHYDNCFSSRDTGDRMLANCIYRSTTTKFTWEKDLHQMDLHGDQSGFYEALRPQPLSLHHWKSEEFRSTIDMHNLSRVATICGDACLLQKFRLNDDWMLTNGFSLVKYGSYDVKHRQRQWDKDISMERTWDAAYEGTRNVHFEHTLGPIRNPDEQKVSYRMESAIMEGTSDDSRKIVRQLYVKRKGVGDEKRVGEVEGVVEIMWSSTE